MTARVDLDAFEADIAALIGERERANILRVVSRLVLATPSLLSRLRAAEALILSELWCCVTPGCNQPATSRLTDFDGDEIESEYGTGRCDRHSGDGPPNPKREKRKDYRYAAHLRAWLATREPST